MTSIPLGSVALAMGRAGMHVFPVLPGQKRPATRSGLKAATTDPKMIRAWWAAVPTANVGVACEPSGLVVIDCDQGKEWPLDGQPPEGCHGGDDLLVMLALEAGADPTFIYGQDSCSVITPSGGLHLYYRAPAGQKVRSSAGRLAPWVDVRAAGGYVVGPFSATGAGVYRPLLGWDRVVRSKAGPDLQSHGIPSIEEIHFDPPALPSWLAERMVEREEPVDVFSRLLAALDREPVGCRDGYAAAALHAETTSVATATQGSRNHTLNRAAYSLGTLVAAGALDEGQVRSALESAAIQCGLGRDEAIASIRSGMRAGMANPREVAGL